MKWIYKLEYKYGKYSIPRLMLYIVVGMGIVYIAQMMIPTVAFMGSDSILGLDRAALGKGQIWRLVTFIFVPPATSNPFLLLISLYFYYTVGNLLQSLWTSFRFTLFYLIGMLGTIAAALITGSATNYYLNLSMFLALATLIPDAEFRLFFILPVKAKWMGLFYVVFAALGIVRSFVLLGSHDGWSDVASFLLSIVAYLLFFGKGLFENIGNEIRIRKNRRNWYNQNR